MRLAIQNMKTDRIGAPATDQVVVLMKPSRMAMAAPMNKGSTC